MGISGLLTGLMGAFYAHYTRVVSPRVLGLEVFIYLVIMVLLGGVGKFPGPAIGAFIIIFVSDWLRQFERWRMLIFGALVVIIVMLAPRGLMGAVDSGQGSSAVEGRSDRGRDRDAAAPRDSRDGGRGGVTDVQELFGFPVEDPAQSLPETAQRLVEAARRLLLAGGFDALRLDAIAAEAGKNKASIKYHFGNKDGLILAILDSLDYDDCLAFAEHTRGTSGDERLQLYIDGQTD